MHIGRTASRAALAGFTLVEMAVVFTIVSFLLASALYLLAAQVDQRNFEETRRRLDQARDLVLAFAVVHGRLPCPARSIATASPVTVAGDEVLTPGTGAGTGCIGDAVTDYYGGASGGVTLGLLPARSIGIQQMDSAGFAVDAWGNRIRYAVARTVAAGTCSGTPITPYFVNSANIKSNGIACQPGDLLICKSANVTPALSTSSCGGLPAGANQIMSQSQLVAVIFSTGKNGATGGTGMDEAANLNGAGGTDPVFVYHTPTPGSASGGEFDDQFTWITVGELYGKLIAAGTLP